MNIVPRQTCGLVILCFTLCVTASAKSQSSRQPGDELGRDLRPIVANYLTRKTSLPNVPFRLHVDVQATGLDRHANPFHVTVRCRIPALAAYPALDVDLASHLSRQLRKRGYTRVGGGAQPTFVVEMGVLKGSGAVSPLLDGAAATFFAFLCLMFLAVIRRKRPSQQYPVQVTPTSGEKENVPARPSPQRTIREKPTPEFLATLESAGPRLQTEGSWYLNALADTPPDDLRAAFASLTFEEALVVLRRVSSERREQLVRMLELRPAIRSRIEEFVTHPAAGPRK